MTSSSSSSTAKSVLIKVPFATQAPFANWDEVHEETCEEAAMLLGQAYFKGETSVSEDTMEQRLQSLLVYEVAHGYGQDVTIAEAAKIASDSLGLKVRVLTNVTQDDLRKELAAGHPIVAPFAGRDLGNPNFTGGGPWYHMLIIIGYDANHFITNDVGTRKGAQYVYNNDVLFSALHDWTGVKEETKTGPKNVLVLDGLL